MARFFENIHAMVWAVVDSCYPYSCCLEEKTTTYKQTAQINRKDFPGKTLWSSMIPVSEIQVCKYSSIKVISIKKQSSCTSEMYSFYADKSPLRLF